ncbi:MAG: hypothetical protein JWP34_4832 [Massilia sp.]|nr:hypothetical protein [Massilia sp.]
MVEHKLSDKVITETVIRCIQWLARHKEIPLSIQEVPSTDDTADARDPGLPTKAGTTLNPTQIFEASSQTRRPSDIGSSGRAPSPPSPRTPLLNQAETSDDEMVVVQLGQEKKRGPPTTLVEALRAKQNKTGAAQSEEKGNALDMLSVARRVEARDFDNKVSSRDICALGGAVLGDVFGGRGQKRLADAFVYLYARQDRPPLERVLEATAETLAQQIRDAGSTVLSDFTVQWARAVQHDSPRASAVEDIQVLHTKVSVVRQWDTWSRPDRLKDDKELEEFLDKKGIAHTKHAPLSNRISKYLSQQLAIPPNQLTKKIYNWTPLVVMADVFGQGIFALMPKSLLTSYNSLRVRDKVSKEAKFRAIVTVIAEELPDLVKLSRYCDEYIVQPILLGQLEHGRAPKLNIRVPGISMAVEGDLTRLRQTSIPGLVCAEWNMPPHGSVEELEESDPNEDADDSG